MSTTSAEGATPSGTGRTVQLRRYVLVDGLLDDFTAWWRSRLVPARRAYGFDIEFSYALPETSEFVWAVSLPGDADAFRAVEADYLASPERAAAFDGQPTWTTSQAVALVREVPAA
ncbi:hypothetical protein [Frondihabitans peucedani]|uniref:NIPSNAP protein n=1 Tax=Frondihabitans peucedani TaxID=598626 RepID=A0ABP8E4M2_9MICO